MGFWSFSQLRTIMDLILHSVVLNSVKRIENGFKKQVYQFITSWHTGIGSFGPLHTSTFGHFDLWLKGEITKQKHCVHRIPCQIIGGPHQLSLVQFYSGKKSVVSFLHCVKQISFMFIPLSKKTLSAVLAIWEQQNSKFSPTMAEDYESDLCSYWSISFTCWQHIPQSHNPWQWFSNDKYSGRIRRGE